MQIKVKNTSSTSRLINIEVSGEELSQKFDQVYQDIGKFARVPGFRPGKAPRDLLETYYSQKAREEVIKRAIPEYYLKAVGKQGLIPVAPPEIESVEFKNQTLYFSAKVDIKPEVRLKGNYKQLRIIKKKPEVKAEQVEQALERLRQSKKKQGAELARDLGFQSLDELKSAIEKNLQANAEMQIKADMERQLIEQLLQKASLDIPESLVNNQMQELIDQLKLNHILQGEKKEEVEAKGKELENQARKEAIRRVKLSFILDEVGQREKIQVNEADLEQRIEAIAQRSGKTKDEVREYLEKQNLISGLKAELRDRKTLESLLNQAKVEEEKQ